MIGKITTALSFTLLAAAALLGNAVHAQRPDVTELDGSPDQPRWYKGNTHAHTVLSGHADSTPEQVAAWYHDRGYHFLILSEHNIFIDPDSVHLPEDRREDFILIPGEEITGRKVIHTTAMNVRGLIDWTADHEQKHAIIQMHVDSTRRADGTPILNHPNYQWALTSDDIRPVGGLHHFELFNGHPHVRNEGDNEHMSTEEIWDDLLTRGMFIYGVSSDDAHDFQRWGREVSNPGRGWIMVHSRELNPDAVTSAMRDGRFYASSGVILSSVERGADAYRVAVDVAMTQSELQSPILLGRRVATGPPGYSIEFIGPRGEILKVVNGVVASFPITDDHAYVRARVTYRRPRGGEYDAFFAWAQPVFTDGREAPAFSEGRR